MNEHLPIHATVRDALSEENGPCVQVEARYADGQKYAVCEMNDDEKGNAMAFFILEALEAKRAGKF